MEEPMDPPAAWSLVPVVFLLQHIQVLALNQSAQKDPLTTLT